MNIITKENSLIGEKYYYAKHKSGLDIYLIPKDMSNNSALICTRYGSIDNCFKLEGDDEFTHVPDGIAHYLEHKMFENEDGVDTFARFAKYGANANAFTWTNGTAYNFECTENFYENLEILLDYVMHPYFTPENVAKEQGIIAQEIRGREDDPYSATYMNLLNILYKDSQAKINVAGTVDSIAEITAETLYKCYDIFYNPSNMFLCVSGTATMEKILEIADKFMPIKDFRNIIRHYNEEDSTPAEKSITAEFEVSKPMFLMGVKDTAMPKDPHERAKRIAAMNIATETLFGDASEFAVDIYESGLIEDLEVGYNAGKIAANFIFGGDTDDVAASQKKFFDYIADVKKNGIDKEAFDIARKIKYADHIKNFESTNIAEEFVFNFAAGDNYFDSIDVISEVTAEYATDIIRELFKEENFAVSIVNPLSKEEE